MPSRTKAQAPVQIRMTNDERMTKPEYPSLPSEAQGDSQAFNRRDFLKGGSVATLMAMMGGVPLASCSAQTNPPASGEIKLPPPEAKVGVIGLGTRGREIVNALVPMEAHVAAICDTYPAALSRCAREVPKATQTKECQSILDDKEIKAVIVATPTHQHKEIVLAALKAGKHVYCEAPLAHTIEDARAIAQAAKAARQQIFQAGLQNRADPERIFLVPFIRSGALGQMAVVRAQWHKKQSWRFPSPNADREKAINWRLDKGVSLGLIGEIGCHQIDEVNWFLNARPVAVTGFGSITLWNKSNKDGPDNREVPDTVQATFEYPDGMPLIYDATLANSFELDYQIYYGSYSAVMLRDNKAWLFQEVDSPQQGWEIYARKDQFYGTKGIALEAGASKSVQVKKPVEEPPFTHTTLAFALEAFLRNVDDLEAGLAPVRDMIKDDPEALTTALSTVKKRAAAGYHEGFQATALAIKANEAVMAGKRVELKPELYELS